MYECTIVSRNNVSNDDIVDLHNKTKDDVDDNSCSGIYTDCGIPILSSIPLLDKIFPRKCISNGDLKSMAAQIISDKNAVEESTDTSESTDTIDESTLSSTDESTDTEAITDTVEYRPGKYRHKQ